MGGLFTREERCVILFLAAAIAVGSLVLLARRVDPALAPVSAPLGHEGDAGEGVRAERWPVDVNSAGPEDLDRLPGIGPARAAAIVRLREERGPYASLDELLEVKGIGRVTLERLLPFATVGDSSLAAGGCAQDSDDVKGEGQCLK